MPNALPSAAIALTRKSGCGQKIASESELSARSTMPTRPSVVTTGASASTPAFLPAESVIVKSSPMPRPCSASAGMKPHFSCGGQAEQLAQALVLLFHARQPLRAQRDAVGDPERGVVREEGAARQLGLAAASMRAARRASRGARPPRCRGRSREGSGRRARRWRTPPRARGRLGDPFALGAARSSCRLRGVIKCSAPTSTSPRRRECARSRARRRSADLRRRGSAGRSPA